MKRYIVFAGIRGQKQGGWNEALRDRDSRQVLSFDTLDEANDTGKERSQGHHYDWYHVVDLHTGEIACFGRK
ncbi:MAG: hypothetical protein AAB972_02520 [Patescibacteria group bacterium]